MDNADRPTDLEVHTIDTLCDELVSGRSVVVPENERPFLFESAETRSVFEWYRRNRAKWAQNNTKVDVESIVDQFEHDPPVLPPIAVSTTSGTPRVWQLRSVRAHRFAGIHLFRSLRNPPEDFEYTLETPLSIVEGKNGSGKTSLLSAVTWCLTGHVYRSQRAPELAEDPVEMTTPAAVDDDGESESVYEASAVTPLPACQVLEGLDSPKLPLDTWVELTLADQDDNIVTVRRSLGRIGRNDRIQVSSPNLDALDVPPVALEIGTRMTGLLPYIEVGDKSDLSSAVADLTGLSPLKDLVIHAGKSRKKLVVDLPKNRQKEINDIEKRFRGERDELEQLLAEHEEVDPKVRIPDGTEGAICDEAIAEVRRAFERLQTEALSGAKEVLGEEFDPADPDARRDLAKNIGPAVALLRHENLKTLSNMKRLRGLGALSEDELCQASQLVDTILSQARDLAELETQRDRAKRVRLYAKVATWVNDHDPSQIDLSVCPVCQTDLEDKRDPVTGITVADHLQQCVDSSSDHFGQTVAEWATAVEGRLHQELPPPLADELRKELPRHPKDLIHDALCIELTANAVFSNSLAPLKKSVVKLSHVHLDDLPPFTEPAEVSPPSLLGDKGLALLKLLGIVRRAIAFARWRKTNSAACKTAFVAVISGGSTEASELAQLDSLSADAPLLTRLKTLAQMVENSEPLGHALRRISKMEEMRAQRVKLEDRIEKYARVATAIAPLLELDALVDRQVGHLMRTLTEATTTWKGQLYQPAYTGAPKVVDTNVASDGTLSMQAETGGTMTAAQHVCNASDLRATMLAFLFAFWQELTNRRGGLSLLLFDDLQELFDPENRQRVATTIAEMIAENAQIVVTTNDNQFGRLLYSAAVHKVGKDSIDRLRILPAKTATARIALDHFVEYIDEKRKAFEENENDDQSARDYVSQLRIHIENRLADFFDEPDDRLPDQPTLSDYINAVRRRVNSGLAAFNSRPFRRLVDGPEFQGGSEFVRIMNESHHGRAHLITYHDVYRIRDDCKRVLDTVHSAHEEYQRWLRREATDQMPDRPVLPCQRRDLSFTAPLVLATAAAAADSPNWETAAEPFNCDWLTHHAIYINRTENLGFACPQNCRVIVDLDGDVPVNNSLVVAHVGNQTYIRRLLEVHQGRGQVVLASENIDPMRRPPTHVLRLTEVRLLNIVGVLFDDTPRYGLERKEAVPDEVCDTLSRVEIAFRARGDSALPLVLGDQILLGGRGVSPREMSEFEGKFVALATTEGNIFKRVGPLVAGIAHVRQFEAIGGRGDSHVVRMEGREDDPLERLSMYLDAREILGVIYRPRSV